MTIKVIPIPGIAPQGAFAGQYSTVNAGADGSFSIDPRDLTFAMNSGYVPARTDSNYYYTPYAPAAASSGLSFASAALSNGTKAIAAQVDIMRPLTAVVIPGASAITAGVLTMTYDANDGTPAFVDALSLATPTSTTKTLTTTKGVARLRSQIITGLTGGTSPTIYIGTTADLSVPIPPGAQDAAIVSEWMDSAITTVANAGTLTAGGFYTPKTAPNATHVYGVAYTTLSQ